MPDPVPPHPGPEAAIEIRTDDLAGEAATSSEPSTDGAGAQTGASETERTATPTPAPSPSPTPSTPTPGPTPSTNSSGDRTNSTNATDPTNTTNKSDDPLGALPWLPLDVVPDLTAEMSAPSSPDRPSVPDVDANMALMQTSAAPAPTGASRV